MAEAVEGAEVAVVAGLEDGFQVELDVAFGEGVVVVTQEPQHDSVSEDRPVVGLAVVEEGLQHVVGRFGFEATAGGDASVQVLGRGDGVEHGGAVASPATVGEGVAQLACLIQDGVTAQVDGLEIEQLEEGEQPASADLGDVHPRQVGSHGVPALLEEFPGSGDGFFQGGRAPGQGKGLRLAALAGAELADVLDEGGGDQAAGGGDVGGVGHQSSPMMMSLDILRAR